MLLPKLFTTLKNYSRKQFFSDCVAGVIVGIVAIPLAIAFGIASGVTPEKGLLTAIVAGLVISVLGGSRVQIGGPTAAFVVIVYGIVQKHGVDGLIIATALAGVLLILMGLGRLGAVIKFVPHPVVVGFTSGIAVVIFLSQEKDFLFNFDSTLIGAATVLIVALWPKVSRKIPGSLVALILSSVVAQIFHLPVETIGSRFGDLPRSLPLPHLPHVDFAVIQSLIPAAFTIALLGSVESLLSAVVSDGMIGGRHRSNMELIAQGFANISSALFGGIPATGAIARTATNVKNGGRTPVAGIVHALTILAVVFFLGQWVKLIPIACLAGILIVVSYHMSEWRSFWMLLKSPRSDVVVLLVTFGLTVFVNLTIAIQIGMVLAAFLFMMRMAQVMNVDMVKKDMADEEEKDDPNAVSTRQIPDGVEVYEINGPFFFGASYKFIEAMNVIEKNPKVRIIRMRNVLSIDATGIHALKEQYARFKKAGIQMILSDLHAQPLVALERIGFLDTIGEQNIFGNIDDALNHSRVILGLPKLERPAGFIPTVQRES